MFQRWRTQRLGSTAKTPVPTHPGMRTSRPPPKQPIQDTNFTTPKLSTAVFVVEPVLLGNVCTGQEIWSVRFHANE